MAGVTLHPAPDDALVTVPDGQFRVRLEDGRTLTSRMTLRVREEMALSEHIGADTRSNPVWMAWATVACCVATIDDEAVRMPVTKAQVEALVDRIGDAGMRVLMLRYRENSAAREARTLDLAKN